MSNDENEKELKVTTEAPKRETSDWNSDFFPVSARPVWIKLGMMFFGVIILGLIAIYYSADEEEEEKPKVPPKQTEDIFTQDEEEK